MVTILMAADGIQVVGEFDIAAEGERVDPADPATISPYISHTVRRFGNWTLNLSPPDRAPTTRLDLEPRVLFAPTPAGN